MKTKFTITSLQSDGSVQALVGEKTYTFHIDTAFFNTLKQLEKKAPGRALNFLKKHNQLNKGDQQ